MNINNTPNHDAEASDAARAERNRERAVRRLAMSDEVKGDAFHTLAAIMAGIEQPTMVALTIIREGIIAAQEDADAFYDLWKSSIGLD